MEIDEEDPEKKKELVKEKKNEIKENFFKKLEEYDKE